MGGSGPLVAGGPSCPGLVPALHLELPRQALTTGDSETGICGLESHSLTCFYSFLNEYIAHICFNA